MNSFFNFQFGSFSQSTPNWFDWLSLILTLIVSGLSILLAYWIAERVYSREKKDRQLEDLEIQDSEIELFKNSISELNSAIQNQIRDIETYKREQNFQLKFHPDIQVDFLQFINVKYLYKKQILF